jgi:sensor histidine kinase YesM
MASLAWQLAFYLGVTAGQRVTFLGQAALMAGVYGLTCVCIYWIEHRISADNDMLDIGWKEMVWALVIGLVIYALSNMSYIIQDSPFSSRFPAEIFIIRTITDLGGLGALLAYHLMLRELQVNMEREYLKRLLHMQGENYRMAEESVALVNQKYHDLKHQIALLRSEIGTDQKLDCLDQVENEIRTYEAQKKTGNEVLDAILTGKCLYCAEHGITMTAVADGHALDFMSVMDLSALFGNALDNAIEAAEQVPDPEQRLIVLSVSQQKGFVKMQVRNRYQSGETITSLPATTKRDKRYHGYGLKSIRSTVEKYGGSVAVHGEDGWFELGVLIPRNV